MKADFSGFDVAHMVDGGRQPTSKADDDANAADATGIGSPRPKMKMKMQMKVDAAVFVDDDGLPCWLMKIDGCAPLILLLT
jgi:hypothetical protein